jgi:CRP-like cAMP-binding protein
MSTEGLGKLYGDHQVIVRQGETGDCMYAIQTGRAEVVRETESGEVRLTVLGEGEIFGEMAILEKEVRSATVRALGDSRVLTIDKKTFLRRVQEDPSLAFNLARTLCRRVRRLSEEVEMLRTAAGRPGRPSAAPAPDAAEPASPRAGER